MSGRFLMECQPASGIPAEQRLPGGIVVHRVAGATVVTVDGARPVDVLEGLRRVGVRRIDVLVTRGREVAELERALRHRWYVGRVIDPSTTGALRIRTGGVQIVVSPGESAAVQVVPG